MSTTPVSEIPTLPLLYKLGKLAAAGEASKYKHNAAFNDTIGLVRTDITKLETDAIVNAANTSLLGGGGVDGAIHRAAGPQLVDECETLGGCATGSAKMTKGYRLPAKKVIHAVGPIYWETKRSGTHTSLLQGCYRTSLDLAVEGGCRSIAFSALSTGIYGYPSDEAAQTVLECVRDWLEEKGAGKLDKIVFCNFMEKDEVAYHKHVSTYFPPGDGDAEKKDSEKAAESSELASKLPDAPKGEPTEEGEPEPKKLKSSHEPSADNASQAEPKTSPIEKGLPKESKDSGTSDQTTGEKR